MGNTRLKNQAYRFEILVQEILNTIGFSVTPTDNFDSSTQLDFYVEFPKYQTGDEPRQAAFVIVKFYRSKAVPYDVLQTAVSHLPAEFRTQKKKVILITSCLVSDEQKLRLENDTGIVTWDRSVILALLRDHKSSTLIEKFERLILESQQGLSIEDPFDGVDHTASPNIRYYFARLDFAGIGIPDTEGEELEERLIAIKEGKEGWSEFEKVGEEILKYLFDDDLSLWKIQQTTEDELSRFDLICRITSKDFFWKTIISSFASRYVLFEFKNYSDPLPAGQVFTTERYLFPKALRGTCILIARRGASQHAISAAKGALRESGKLILLLDEDDLIKMLKMRSLGDSPNDYLSEKLDKMLISLAR